MELYTKSIRSWSSEFSALKSLTIEEASYLSNRERKESFTFGAISKLLKASPKTLEDLVLRHTSKASRAQIGVS